MAILEAKPLHTFFTALMSGLGWSLERAGAEKGGFFPQARASAGIELEPWLALGAYTQVAVLSALEHADFGTRIADTDNAFMQAGGSELLLMPWAQAVLHPMIRLSLGGVTVGYMEDTDDEEGFDRAVTDRWFHASASVGGQLNLSRHLRVWGLAGYRFVGNQETLGIPSGGLSGLEASFGLRYLWRTVAD